MQSETTKLATREVVDDTGRRYEIPLEVLSQFEAEKKQLAWPRRRYGEKPLDFGEDGHVGWIEKSLKSLPAGWRLLDAGAGPLRYKKFAEHLRYVSQDFCQYNGTGRDSGIHPGQWDTSGIDLVCDIHAIPEPDASFDAVLCVSVLEHLADPARALKDFARLLRSGGKLILTAPFAGVTHLAPYHFYTGFPRYFYEKYLQNEFIIDDIHPNGALFEFLNTYFHYILSFANKYTHEKATTWEELAIDGVTAMLERFALSAKDSGDVLNFGYQIVATRR
jgi:SAM-dependent methyltransferase